jgi:HSP20 family protein
MTRKPLRRKRPDRPLEDAMDMDRFFDEYMSRIEEQMADFFEDAMETRGPTKGFIFGFHMTSGPDGKPAIEEFGSDVREADEEEDAKAAASIKETRLAEIEPLTDVIDSGKEVRVLAELPGIAREDLKIDVKPEEVTIKVDTATRKYRKNISLPCRVSTENVKTTHKNGILEIIISKSI